MSDLLQDDLMKEQTDPMIHVRVSPDLRALIEREAEKDNRTLSGQVRHYIVRAIEARQPTAAA